MRAINLVLATHTYPPEIRGGGEISVGLLVEALARLPEIGKVHVVTVGSRQTDQLSEKISIHRYPVSKRLLRKVIFAEELANRPFYRALSGFLKTESVDLLHSYNTSMIFAADRAAREAKVPCLITMNTPWVSCINKNHLRNGKFCNDCTFTHRKQCMDQDARPLPASLKAAYGGALLAARKKAIAAHSVHHLSNIYFETGIYQRSNRDFVLPNGLSDPALQVARRFEAPAQLNKICYLGGDRYGKGFDVLLEAFRIARRFRPELELHCFGRIDSDETGLSNPSENIFAHGFAPQAGLYAKLRDMQTLVVPSTRVEPFGRVVLDGLACGVPVLVSDHVGGKDVVNEQCARIYPFDQPLVLAKQILEVLSNRDKWLAMAQHAQQRASSYSIAQMAKGFLGIYKQVLGLDSPTEIAPLPSPTVSESKDLWSSI
jgi:glycosyltransferase involved in cell wall biosynthesis